MYQLIESGDKPKSILTLLNSDLINFILKITQYSEAPNYKNEFKILNMISKPNDITLNNDNDVYRYYGLNSKEINLVKSIVEKTGSKKTEHKTKKHKGGKKHITQKTSNRIRRHTRKSIIRYKSTRRYKHK